MQSVENSIRVTKDDVAMMNEDINSVLWDTVNNNLWLSVQIMVTGRVAVHVWGKIWKEARDGGLSARA